MPDKDSVKKKNPSPRYLTLKLVGDRFETIIDSGLASFKSVTVLAKFSGGKEHLEATVQLQNFLNNPHRMLIIKNGPKYKLADGVLEYMDDDKDPEKSMQGLLERRSRLMYVIYEQGKMPRLTYARP